MARISRGLGFGTARIWSGFGADFFDFSVTTLILDDLLNYYLNSFNSNSFVVYYDKQKISGSGLTIFDTTVVNPFPLFFFGDNHVETEGAYELISIAGHYW